jgi:hypothetical protein
MVRERASEFAVPIVLVACVFLGVARSSSAAITLRVTITPTAIQFANANPRTTPVVSANSTVRVRVYVSGALSYQSWSVRGLAGGNLISGGNTIPISTVSWTSSKTGGSCLNWCSCVAGTASSSTPQMMLQGQGNTGYYGVDCTQTYRFANSWTYQTGTYSQVMTITASSP